jgi:small-conductance mechanosensitive channel
MSVPLSLSLLGNPLDRWAVAIALAVASSAVLVLARSLILRRVCAYAERTENRLDDMLAAMLGATWMLFILAVGCYVGSLMLELSPKRELALTHAAVNALLIQAAIWGDVGLRFWRDRLRIRLALQDPASTTSAGAMVFLLRVLLWVVVVLLMLDNLGFNITALVTSLGIGGIAVALAVQNILGDLFASLSIVLDKPFAVGDFIIVGDALGTVEHIGLKTTRLRGLGGEQVIFANGELLKSRIQNHQRMNSRRVALQIRLSYKSSEAQLREIPLMLRAIIRAEPRVAFERAHLAGFGEWSLDFEAVYHVNSADYQVHMDIQQSVLLALYGQLERAAIELAVRVPPCAAPIAPKGPAPSFK